MRGHLLALASALLTPALVIWQPPCHDVEIGSSSKPQCVHGTSSSAGNIISPRTDGITYELHRRKSLDDGDVPGHVARQVSRLVRKVSSLRGTRTSQLDSREHNEYTIQTAVAPTTANSAGLDQDGADYSYFIQVRVGSAQKPMYMLVDTGSTATWVMGTSCQSKICSMHNLFGPSDSTSYKSMSTSFSVSYGTGSIGGTLVHDTLTVAGIPTSMTFGAANTTSGDFILFPFDGVLGLSMMSGTTDNYLDVLKRGKALGSNIFSMSFNRHVDGPNDGEITFGATDPTKFTGTISYTSVKPAAKGDWAIPLGDFAYKGKVAGISGRLVYLDTGTTFIFGPPSDVAAVHALIPGSSSSDGIAYNVPCDSNTPITVTFSGVSYSISPKDWLVNSGGGCTSNIYGHEVVAGAWLLGDVFLKNVYTVFDADAARIGFASKAASPVATTSPTTSFLPSGPATSSMTATGSGTDPMTGPVPPNTSSSSLSASDSGSPTINETLGATATPSAGSAGGQVGRNKYAPIMCIVAVVVVVAG